MHVVEAFQYELGHQDDPTDKNQNLAGTSSRSGVKNQ